MISWNMTTSLDDSLDGGRAYSTLKPNVGEIRFLFRLPMTSRQHHALLKNRLAPCAFLGKLIFNFFFLPGQINLKKTCS